MWTLLIWTSIATSGVQDWRPMVTNLESEQACKTAASKLSIDPRYTAGRPYRCIGPKG